MRLNKDKKKRILIRAIELVKKEEFMCVAVNLAAEEEGISLFVRPFSIIPELRHHEYKRTLLFPSAWFPLKETQIRVDILTEILENL